MSVSRGVVYVAYGKNARDQAMLSAQSLRKQHPEMPFRVLSDRSFPRVYRFPDMPVIHHKDTDPGARGVKLNVDTLSPFDHTLYLDADTRVQGDITMPFDLLDNGWEMCIVPCRRQADNAHSHVNTDERETTFEEVGDGLLALQGGVIWFRKCEAVHRLFAAWREEWARWEDQDQAALVRALVTNPVRVFLLNRQYNGGRIVRHFYKYARRPGMDGAASKMI